MKLHQAYLFLTCFAVSPALAHASAAVAASLGGGAQAGTSTIRPMDRPREQQIARGSRTDDTSNCDTSGVTMRPGDGSASTGSGSRVEYFGCEAAENRNRR
jgi:hypothetical protein